MAKLTKGGCGTNEESPRERMVIERRIASEDEAKRRQRSAG
jgi:hypothetical protein